MNKLFFLFTTVTLITVCEACDSGNANEPDQHATPADSIPQVTPPEQKPQGLDSVIIPEGLELVDYVPHNGPVEPLSDEIRPLMTDGKKWTVLCVYSDQRYNSAFADSVVGPHIHSDNGFEYKVVTRLPDYSFTRKDYLEVNGAVFGSFPSGPCLKRFDVNPTESISFPDTESHPSYSLIIVSRGKITLLGKERRAVKVWTGPESLFATYDYWVEGIGPLYYTYADYDIVLSIPSFRVPYMVLVQCVDGNGELLYDYRDFDPDLYEEIEVFTDVDKQFYAAQQQ